GGRGLMNPFVRLLHTLGAPRTGTPSRPRSSRPAARWQPALEVLEDRTVPSAVSAITSNFNGTAVPAGDYIWFSSVAKVKGVGSPPLTLRVTDQPITFTASGTAYTLNVPDTVLTLTPGATTAATTFDSVATAWNTSAPATFSGNVFLSGLAFQATARLPG